MEEPALQYISSRWINSEGHEISECAVYDPVQIEVQVENSLRKTTIANLMEVSIYKDSAALFADLVQKESFSLILSPLSTETKRVNFTPSQESRYHYKIRIEKKEIYCQPKSVPPRLCASKKEICLTLDEPLGKVHADSTMHFTGKLFRPNPGEGVDGAKIHIYDERRTRKDNLLASGTTNKDGTFDIECRAKRTRLWQDTIYVYSKFIGDDLYKPSVSNRYTIRLTTQT